MEAVRTVWQSAMFREAGKPTGKLTRLLRDYQYRSPTPVCIFAYHGGPTMCPLDAARGARSVFTCRRRARSDDVASKR